MRRNPARRLLPLLLLALAVAPGFAAEQGGPAGVDLRLATHLGAAREFVEGDRIGWLISLNRAAHVYLFYRDAGGDLWQLLPHARQPEHRFPAGVFQPLPGRGNPWRFVIRPPFGEETLYAFASDRGQLAFPLRPGGGELARLAIDIEAIEARIRAASRQVFDRAVLTLSTRSAVVPDSER